MIHPVDIAALNLLTEHDDVVTYINALMQVERPEDNEEKFWFPTLEHPGNEQEHSPIQKRISKELRDLAELEKLDPSENEETRNKFLSMFNRTDSLITGNDRKNFEDTIVEFNSIVARHRLDIGMNTQFKVSLSPQDDKPVYTQNLPVPINLKEDLTVELALMHRYGIITILPFSKYASPIFAQRKPNSKLKLLVDLRKINALIADDYINNNHPVSMNQTSFPIIGLAFLRKHAAILDTAQGTIDFPKFQITMALTDERQKCNLKPITIKTEAKHTIPAHSTRIIYAAIPVSTEHPITGTIQP